MYTVLFKLHLYINIRNSVLHVILTIINTKKHRGHRPLSEYLI